MDKKIGEKSERRAVTEMGRPRIFTDEERIERRRAQQRAYRQRPEVKAQQRAYRQQKGQIEKRRFACDLKKEPWELLAEVGYYDARIKKKRG